MGESNAAVESSATGAWPEMKKKRWDTVLAYTPVVLTVLATLLAGQSSTQMSLAQYHRALAAQHQAKAGDQWSFFQAKRIRGENFEASADLAGLWGATARVEPASVFESLGRLCNSIKQVEQGAQRLVGALDQTAETQVGRSAQRLLDVTRREAMQLDGLLTSMDELMIAESSATKHSIVAALRYLNPPYPALREGEFDDPALRAALATVRSSVGREPGGETPPAAGSALDTVLDAIRQRRTDTEGMPELAAVDARTLERTLATVAADAAAFDEWSAMTEQAIEWVGDLVRRAVAATSAVNRAVGEAVAALGQATAVPDELRSTAGPLVQSSETSRRIAEQVARDILAGRHSFTAWRYEIEARYNQAIAELHEVKVLKSSAESSRYLKRSWGYFYAQLAVQAAMTVATLALAVRQRNLLWSLACAASVVALLYASAVLLDAAPVPGV